MMTMAVAIVSTPFLRYILIENLWGYDNIKFCILYMNKLEQDDEYRNVAKKSAELIK